MSKKSSIYRTIEILEILNGGKKVCIGELANRYDVSKRTIFRDFELICEIFGDFIHKEKECYRAYKKIVLEDVLSATDLMTLANILNLFGELSLQNSITHETKALIKRSLSVYDFKTRPFEAIQNRDILKNIEYAIKFRKVIEIEYKVSRKNISFSFHPYKILFLSENFYLVGENITKNRFEFLRVSMIGDIKDTKNSFYHSFEIVDFVKKIQTPWSIFGKDEFEVRLRVFKKIRKYFKLKKYLPSQEIVKTFENGDIEVLFRVSDFKEVEEIIIKWLPQVEILTPTSFKKVLKKLLKKKMQGL